MGKKKENRVHILLADRHDLLKSCPNHGPAGSQRPNHPTAVQYCSALPVLQVSIQVRNDERN
jgi:hypothetical protein